MNQVESITKPVAVVTGASGGLGAVTCRLLSINGYVIIAHYGKRIDQATDLSHEIHQAGGVCHMVSADLSTPEGINNLLNQVKGILAENPDYQLATLVNNAAKLLSPPFMDTTTEDFDTYFAINTRAPFFVTQGLSSEMAPGSSIVNVSSASAHFSSPGDITYAMSKAAVESMTKNLAEALAPRGIRVNAVIPGFTNNGHPGFSNEKVLEYMSSFSVLGGVSDPETVAEAILFLASEKAKRSTGTLLDVTGGSILGARGSRKLSVKELL